MTKVIEVGPSSLGVSIIGAPPMTPLERAIAGHLLGIDISLAQLGREPVAEVIDFKEASARLRSARAEQSTV